MTISIYTKVDDLPTSLLDDNFFHSRQLFLLAKQTPRHRPYMVTVEDDNQEVLGQMLCLVRYRSSFFPPYFYIHCIVNGEGTYREGADKAACFSLMLDKITERFGSLLLYIEISHLSQKMFGFREFRKHNFFPVRWVSIYNSLHSHTPEEYLDEPMLAKVKAIEKRGVVTTEVSTDDDFRQFTRLLRHYNWFKPKRYLPPDEFFRGMMANGHGKLFLTRYNEKAIGCSAMVYSNGQAYLWYAAFKRKSYLLLHPDIAVVWHAIKDAETRRMEHIYFLDVGLPFRKNQYRDFLLSFGGKPVSTYRWFRTSIHWLNVVFSWIYRD